MGEEAKKSREDGSPQLLNLISYGEWRRRERNGKGESGDEEGVGLELSLGLSGGRFSMNFNECSGAKRGGFLDPRGRHQQQQQSRAARAALGKELSLRTIAGSGVGQQQTCEKERKAGAASHANTSTTTTQSNKQAAVPVVGWPPVRIFRKNLTSNSLKQSSELQNIEAEARSQPASKKRPFIKINMDGIPIGRKIDLATCTNYNELTSAVKELFQGLLEAQKDPSDVGSRKVDMEDMFTSLLDGTGKYTLVYEDNEGDRILVGDVPWKDFVSSVKRLRVLRSSELYHGMKRGTAQRAMDC